MISRYLFICTYFLTFFLLNRWYDLYQYYFHQSKYFGRGEQQEIISIEQLNIKQLQYILNLRGISFVNIHEKNDLIQLVEQTGEEEDFGFWRISMIDDECLGFVRENELSEPIEDENKRRTTRFSSYKQLLDFVDDCKDTIWFVHIIPNEDYRQSLIYLSFDHWHKIERRLSIFNIQTGLLNCSNIEYSNLCRSLKNERFILLIPSINRRSTNIYYFDIYSFKHFHYQYILKWLSKTLENHVKKNFDWYELPKEKRSILEFQISSTTSHQSIIPIYYFTLLYRYGSIINFQLKFQEKQSFEIKYIFQNSTNQIYIYNQRTNLHEFYSFRSLNIFLSCLTMNIQTLFSFYFILLNIYLFYEIYFVQSMNLLKKILIMNLLSGIFWLWILNSFSTETIDYFLEMFSFDFIQYSINSKIFMLIRNDFFIYSIISKWILYSTMIVLHILLGLSFRWYLKEKFGRFTYDFRHDILFLNQIHDLCSKLWQSILCILFSDQGPNDHINNTFLQYFSPDSLWLHQHSLLILNSNETLPTRSPIDFNRLPIWRFTIRRRRTTHGASESYSDIELEQSGDLNDQDVILKKPFMHRRLTNLVSLTQQDNCYTSESDENNNSLNSNLIEMNSSEIYQCTICLEKYIHNVYICTLPCLHHFHRKCLFNWLCNSEHTTCPLCRSPVINE